MRNAPLMFKLEPAREPGSSDVFDALVRPDGMVHRTLFTDPAIFDLEMRKIFGGTWVFLAHETEIPNANDFKCVNIGRRPVIVCRTESGEIRALLNRCTHRGSAVCAADHGNADRFQCPYHGWVFSNTGELRTVTFADGYGEGFDKAAHNLGRFPRVASYRGYVFGSLNPEVEPLLEWIGPAREVIDWSIDALNTPGSRAVKYGTMAYAGNWKLQNDNNGDMYHVPITHRSVGQMTSERHGAGKSLDHFRGDRNPMGREIPGPRPQADRPAARITSVGNARGPSPAAETYAEALEQRPARPRPAGTWT